MSNGSSAFVLAHLSDLHATDATPARPRELLGKRLLGWLSWRRRRRHEHLGSVLEALLDDLRAQRPDHVAVTGDLTHIGLPSEIRQAVGWLARVGPPEAVSLVPGNHDAYAPSADPDPWAPWAPYMRSRDAAGLPVASGAGADRFPYARRLGTLAVVGASSALPTAPLLATGRLGAPQIERIEATLAALGDEGRFRVLLLHHPPVPAGQSRRRQLDDAAPLRAALARSGAELVLHGHTHRTRFATLPGPQREIPVVGVPSASSIGPSEARRARYHLLRVEPLESPGGGRFRISYESRGYDRTTRRFVHEGGGAL